MADVELDKDIHPTLVDVLPVPPPDHLVHSAGLPGCCVDFPRLMRLLELPVEKRLAKGHELRSHRRLLPHEKLDWRLRGNEHISLPLVPSQRGGDAENGHLPGLRLPESLQFVGVAWAHLQEQELTAELLGSRHRSLPRLHTGILHVVVRRIGPQQRQGHPGGLVDVPHAVVVLADQGEVLGPHEGTHGGGVAAVGGGVVAAEEDDQSLPLVTTGIRHNAQDSGDGRNVAGRCKLDVASKRPRGRPERQVGVVVAAQEYRQGRRGVFRGLGFLQAKLLHSRGLQLINRSNEALHVRIVPSGLPHVHGDGQGVGVASRLVALEEQHTTGAGGLKPSAQHLLFPHIHNSQSHSRLV
mmetsp:Transcript_86592/g.232175  ORF Transcript_86592/g.232175 Transcript_86592/m.232175 type:complete len:354 (-) Transcript_86592:535-1596(-)